MATFIIDTTDIKKANEVCAKIFKQQANKVILYENNIKFLYYYIDDSKLDLINISQIEYEPGKYWGVVGKKHSFKQYFI